MNTKQAKVFLADQAAQQAALDRSPLSDLEKRMMYLTESDPASCDDPVSLHEEFEGKYDDVEYEAKMSRLLSRANKRWLGIRFWTSLLWSKNIASPIMRAQ